jgi:hypothetical protein
MREVNSMLPLRICLSLLTDQKEIQSCSKASNLDLLIFTTARAAPEKILT